MKKRFFLGLTGLVIMAAAITATVTSVNASSTESNLLNRNLEALAKGEGDDCNYENGYTSFGGRDGGAYDCCRQWRDMRPMGDKCQ